jgi:peptidyl-dipeptidase Dcp
MKTLWALSLSAPILLSAGPEAANPLLAPWKTPQEVPPFQEIRPEHFLPAVQEAISRHAKEVAAIRDNPQPATFQNTVAALDDSGGLLTRVDAVFHNLRSAESSPELQKAAAAAQPLLAAHQDDIALDPGLFQRVKEVWDQRDRLGLKGEDARLLEVTYRDFVRQGALLGPKAQKRLRELNQELGRLSMTFGQNLLKETNRFRLVVDQEAELKGLPPASVQAAKAEADRAGMTGKWVFTLHAPSSGPVLQFAENRELRRRMFEAMYLRCDRGDELDNKTTLARIVRLRMEKAQLLGYPTWAHFVLDDRMAKTPARVHALIDQVWEAAAPKARKEMKDLQKLLDKDAPGQKLQPWDVRFYSEKERQLRLALDEQELRPYLGLDRVMQGAFQVAGKLYGVTLVERKDLPTYHSDVRAFEVRDKGGSLLGIHYVDPFPRPGKRAGAWMSNYREQWVDQGKEVRPVTVNVWNFPRPLPGQPALLSPREAQTVFHEFGHALHSLLSRCRYRGLGGTNVPWDFVELPSQIMEHWVTEPAVLADCARHYQTGEPMPEALVQKLRKSLTFNQGIPTLGFLAAMRLDMAWHSLDKPQEGEAGDFEQRVLDDMRLPGAIRPIHRSPAFAHIFDGGYSAGYYSYLWGQVLDSDAFEAFKETGDIFSPAVAKRFREHVLSKGGSVEVGQAYRSFRGADPQVTALLKNKGLL